MRPETRYARSGDGYIAYQVVGAGPLDLVLVPGWVSNVELMWEEPTMERLLDRLVSFTRLILFDKRATGLSDRIGDLPDLETRMGDLRVVTARGPLRPRRRRRDVQSVRGDVPGTHRRAGTGGQLCAPALE